MFNSFKRTRVVPVVLVLGLAAVLSACSGSSGSTTGSSTPAAGAVSVDVGNGTITPKNANNIAVMIQAGPTYSDSAAKAEGAKAAAKDLGVNVDIFWSALDPGTEVSNYNTIMTSGKYGALAVQPVSPQLCKTIAADSVKAQMLVTVFGGPLCATGTETGDALKAPGTITYVDQNNLTEGATIMYNGAADLLGTGPEKVLLVFGNQGHTTVVAHEKAWDEFAATHPNWTVAGKIYTDWTTPGAYSAAGKPRRNGDLLDLHRHHGRRRQGRRRTEHDQAGLGVRDVGWHRPLGAIAQGGHTGRIRAVSFVRCRVRRSEVDRRGQPGQDPAAGDLLAG
jgi:ABC-type sugar transport system substrate-binding protein